MCLVDYPAEAVPGLLEGLTCDGFHPWEVEPAGNRAECVSFLPEELNCSGKETAPGSASFLADDFISSTEDAADPHASAHSVREMIAGLGWALLVHLSLVLAALLLHGAGPVPAAQSQFITVDLVGSGGAGSGGAAGSGGLPEGSGTPAAGAPSPAPVPMPAQEEAASVQPETEVQAAPTPEEPAQPSVVPPPSEAPVPREKPRPVIVPKPAKKQAVAAVRPKPARPPDTRAYTRTDAGDTAPVIRSETPGSDTCPGGIGTEGSGSGRSGSGAGDGGSGQGFGGGGGGSGAGTGGTPGEFTVQQVEQPPVVLHKVHPHFPEAARRMGITGKVLVKFLVKPDGHVTRASILEVDPAGHFEQCVMEALCQWEFKPGMVKGKAVATWVVQPIHFKLAK